MSQRPGRHHVLTELGRIDMGDHDLHQVLGRVTELARAAIAGADHVSVTLVDIRGPRTAAYLGEAALQLDEQQYQRARGPCLDAADSGGAVLVEDMATERRWPDYTPHALRCGVQSSLSVGLPPLGPVSGALNLYGGHPHGFSRGDQELAKDILAAVHGGSSEDVWKRLSH